MTKLLSIGLAFMVAGCISSGPANNASFSRIGKIEDLEGVYQNRGEGPAHSYPVYLSRIIWPGGSGVYDASIATIEVRKVAPDTLRVRVVADGVVQKESLFIQGKDFDLTSGRIRLKQSAGVMGFKAGEPLVGPTYESAELGLDESGQGKYRESSAVAGLVYLFLPIAVGEDRDVRFPRLKE